jgi:hypothetical protein
VTGIWCRREAAVSRGVVEVQKRRVPVEFARPWLVVLVVASLLLTACADDDDALDGGSLSDDELDQLLDDADDLEVPPLPDEDLSVEIEGGSIVFHGLDPADRGLVRVEPDGEGDPTTVGLDDHAGVSGPAVAPDGVTIAALGWPDAATERADTLLVGTLDDGFEPLLVDDELDMWCVRWFPAGDRLLLTAFVEDDFSPVLLEVDLGGETTQHTVPQGRYDCAIPIDDDRVILTYLGMDTDIQGMAMADLATGEAELYFMKLGCMIYGGALSPDRTELVTTAACEVPADSGVHVIDLDTGEAEHLVVGLAVFPAYSPTGEWIAFTLYPDVNSDEGSTWAIRRDGAGFRQVTEAIGAQPAWVGESNGLQPEPVDTGEPEDGSDD